SFTCLLIRCFSFVVCTCDGWVVIDCYGVFLRAGCCMAVCIGYCPQYMCCTYRISSAGIGCVSVVVGDACSRTVVTKCWCNHCYRCITNTCISSLCLIVCTCDGWVLIICYGDVLCAGCCMAVCIGYCPQYMCCTYRISSAGIGCVSVVVGDA